MASRSSTADGTLAVVLLAIALLGVGAFVTLSALSATEYDTRARSEVSRGVVPGTLRFAPGTQRFVTADPRGAL